MERKDDLVANIMESIDDELQFEFAWELLQKLPARVLAYIINLQVRGCDLEQANAKLRERVTMLENQLAPETPTPRGPRGDCDTITRNTMRM